jgi:hypothetical protein
MIQTRQYEISRNQKPLASRRIYSLARRETLISNSRSGSKVALSKLVMV